MAGNVKLVVGEVGYTSNLVDATVANRPAHANLIMRYDSRVSASLLANTPDVLPYVDESWK